MTAQSKYIVLVKATNVQQQCFILKGSDVFQVAIGYKSHSKTESKKVIQNNFRRFSHKGDKLCGPIVSNKKVIFLNDTAAAEIFKHKHKGQPAWIDGTFLWSSAKDSRSDSK